MEKRKVDTHGWYCAAPAEPTDPVEPTEPVDPNPTEPVEPTEPTEPVEGEGQKFSKEQLQQLGSMTGRLIKKQFDEDIVPLLQTRTPAPTSVPGEGSAVDKFNEKLQEMVFSGDVMGAMRMARQVDDNAKTNLTKSQETETARLITTYSNKPYYKDIYSDMKTFASEAAAKGFPPEAATEFAFEKATSKHLQTIVGGGNPDEGSLEMTGGGRRTTRTKTPTLPPEFKEAAARDIAKGIFKDEKDYISALSPIVRERHGI